VRDERIRRLRLAVVHAAEGLDSTDAIEESVVELRGDGELAVRAPVDDLEAPERLFQIQALGGEAPEMLDEVGLVSRASYGVSRSIPRGSPVADRASNSPGPAR
jgi:hypothetical protein